MAVALTLFRDRCYYGYALWEADIRILAIIRFLSIEDPCCTAAGTSCQPQ